MWLADFLMCFDVVLCQLWFLLVNMWICGSVFTLLNESNGFDLLLDGVDVVMLLLLLLLRLLLLFLVIMAMGGMGGMVVVVMVCV